MGKEGMENSLQQYLSGQRNALLKANSRLKKYAKTEHF